MIHFNAAGAQWTFFYNQNRIVLLKDGKLFGTRDEDDFWKLQEGEFWEDRIYNVEDGPDIQIVQNGQYKQIYQVSSIQSWDADTNNFNLYLTSDSLYFITCFCSDGLKSFVMDKEGIWDYVIKADGDIELTQAPEYENMGYLISAVKSFIKKDCGPGWL